MFVVFVVLGVDESGGDGGGIAGLGEPWNHDGGV